MIIKSGNGIRLFYQPEWEDSGFKGKAQDVYVLKITKELIPFNFCVVEFDNGNFSLFRVRLKGGVLIQFEDRKLSEEFFKILCTGDFEDKELEKDFAQMFV